MIRSTRLLVLLALACASLSSQDVRRKYFLQRSVTGTLNRITIRQPASGARALQLDGVFFACSVLCTPKISKNGTLTGGSSGAAIIAPLDERAPATPVAVVTLDGTVASDTTIFTRDIQANSERAHGGGLHLPASGNKQITVELTSGSSGVLYIYEEISEP